MHETSTGSVRKPGIRGCDGQGMLLPISESERASISAKNVTTSGIMEILRRQDFKCALTARSLTPQSASLDHIVPISRGGKHELANLQILDSAVNRAKGTMTDEEFVSLCQEVIAKRIRT